MRRSSAPIARRTDLTAQDTIATSTGDRPSAAKAWLRALELTAAIGRNPTRTLAVMFADLAQQFGDAQALISERETLTYRGLAARANRYARWALAQGLRRGERVALMMPNRPEYMAIWLGITQVGGVACLVNTNLMGASLAHSIAIVEARHIIVDAGLAAAVVEALAHLAARPTVWSHGDAGRDRARIDRDIEARSGSPLEGAERVALTVEDPALCIYTSGTTGLPKAANVNHFRAMMWMSWFAGMMDTRPSDRMYDCLPMYHSIGGIAAPGAVLLNGGSVVIREKFSASAFWDEVRRFDCTLIQHIGEICRYLVNTPEQPGETAHRIRLACGNGLRPDVWEAFKTRFRIPHILEFYAATEGNVTLFNYEEKVGAIGRIPPFLVHRFPTMLIRLDPQTQEPVRDADGLCLPCAPDEPGEAVGRIRSASADLTGRFEGYTSRDDTERKVLHDVAQPGDAWFRTGDLMRRDAKGFFYFVDRIGDTFRRKGENVSTSEVAEVLTGFPGIAEATVYGVGIPGTDGRAGMAALVCDEDLDLAALRQHLNERLPGYARPLFLRMRREIAVTGTFKHRKTELASEGYDPSVIRDPLYFDDPVRQAFVPLDASLHARINGGGFRL
jgi:fatty-acyl-CoA synthase